MTLQGPALTRYLEAGELRKHIPFLGSLLKNEQDTAAVQDFEERGGDMPSEWSELGPRYNQ